MALIPNAVQLGGFSAINFSVKPHVLQFQVSTNRIGPYFRLWQLSNQYSHNGN